MPHLRRHTLRDHHASIRAAAVAWHTHSTGSPLRAYGLRHGVAHALTAERPDSARQLVTDFPTLQARLRQEQGPGAPSLSDDATATARHLSADTAMTVWAAFFRERIHLLRRGNVHWGAEKILLQLAMEHADDSPVTAAAEAWLEEGLCDWLWLRRARRSKRATSHACVRVFAEHDEWAGISGVERLNDGRLVSWGDDTLRIWSLDATRSVAALAAHRSAVVGVRQLSNGRLLSWGADATLRVWDVAECTPVAVLEQLPTRVKDAVELSDQQVLFWGGMHLDPDLRAVRDPVLRIWHPSSGDPPRVLAGHTQEVLGGTATDDGRIVSWSADNTLRLWDPETASCLRVLALPYRPGNRSHTVQLVAVDTNRAVVWSGLDDHTGSMVCLHSLTLVGILRGHPRPIKGATNLRNDRVLTWCAQEMRVWCTTTGACLAVLCPEPPADSRLGGPLTEAIPIVLASGNVLWPGPSVHVWELSSFRRVARFDHPGGGNHVCERSDGAVVSWTGFTTGACELVVWDWNTGFIRQILRGHRSQVRGVLALPDGLVASWCDGGTLRLWDPNADTAADTLVLDGHTKQVQDVWPLDDTRIVTCAHDATVRIWDCEAAVVEACLEGHTRGVSAAEQVADDRLVSWSEDEQEFCLWDLPSKRLVFRNSNVLASTEDRILARGQTEETLEVWDLNTGTLTATLTGHTGWISKAQFLSDGRVISWADDWTLRIWDAATGACRAICHGHRGLIRGFEALPEQRLASWADDHTVCIWNSDTGQLIRRLPHPGSIEDVQYLPNGMLLTQAKWPQRLGQRPGWFLWNSEHADGPIPLLAHWGLELLEGGFLIGWAEGRLSIWNTRTHTGYASADRHENSVQGTLQLPGDRLLTWSRDRTLRIWCLQTAQSLHTFTGHTSWVMGALIHSDGRILSWDESEQLRLWDPETAVCQGIWEAAEAPHAEPELWAAAARWRAGNALSCGGATGGAAYLLSLHLCFGSAATASWHAEGLWAAMTLLPSGILFARQGGDVAFLHLYHGRRRITLAEAEARLLPANHPVDAGLDDGGA